MVEGVKSCGLGRKPRSGPRSWPARLRQQWPPQWPETYDVSLDCTQSHYGLRSRTAGFRERAVARNYRRTSNEEGRKASQSPPKVLASIEGQAISGEVVQRVSRRARVSKCTHHTARGCISLHRLIYPRGTNRAPSRSSNGSTIAPLSLS